jgi:hypothetical protein
MFENIKQDTHSLDFKKDAVYRSSIDSIISDLAALPTSGANGTTIAWTSTNPAIANDGTVTRPAFGSGDAKGTLTATITKGEASDTIVFTFTVLGLPSPGIRPSTSPSPSPSPRVTPSPSPTGGNNGTGVGGGGGGGSGGGGGGAAGPVVSATPKPSVSPGTTPKATASPKATPKATAAKTAKPAASKLSAEAIGLGVKLAWSPSDNSRGYNVYRSSTRAAAANETGKGKADKVNRKPVSGGDFVDVNAGPDITWYYTVYKITSGSGEEALRNANGTIAVAGATTGEMSELDPFGGERGFLLMKIGKATMVADGAVAEIDPGRGTAPVLLNDRTLVPIRAIVEAMGGDVGWDEDQQKVTLDANGGRVEMWLEQNGILVNGKAWEIDVAPTTINDRTMLPVRFVVENLGCQIEWIEATEEIVIAFPAVTGA